MLSFLTPYAQGAILWCRYQLVTGWSHGDCMNVILMSTVRSLVWGLYYYKSIVYTHVYTCTHKCTCAYTHRHTYMHMHTCTHTYTHAQKHTHIHTQTDTRTHTLRQARWRSHTYTQLSPHPANSMSYNNSSYHGDYITVTTAHIIHCHTVYFIILPLDLLGN